MNGITEVRKLRISSVGSRICVMVVKSWMERFENHQKTRLLILADEQGNRISATVHNYLLGKFDIIREGEWYVIENYSVKPKPEQRKWTEHDFNIFFEDYTEAVCVSKSIRLEFFQSIPKILDYTIASKMTVVDVIGGIIKVWRSKEEECTHPSEINTVRVREQLKFRISDENDNHIDCYAHDDIADEFEVMWMNRNFNKILFVALKYWDIKSDAVTDNGRARLCLSAESTYSELIYYEPDSICLQEYRRRCKRAPAFNRRIEDGYEARLRVLDVWKD